MFSLTRFFAETLPVLEEILNEASFPEEEITIWKTRSIQALKVNNEKVSYLAKTGFMNALFGNLNPYGFTPEQSAYENINQEKLITFFQKGYPLQKAIIIISGKIDDAIFDTVNRIFGSIKITGSEASNPSIPVVQAYVPSKIKIEKKDSVQSAIRIGKRLFGKNHPDYISLSIVNTILGGYFGSRLMSNIREDKGYTYGIGSGIHPFKSSGSFFIATEVGTDVCSQAVTEIYSELARLISEPVPVDELELVKKYLAGAFLRSLDGPFALSDRFKGLILHNLDYDYLNTYLEALQTINPLQIMEIASKHLTPDSMTEVISG